MERLGSRTVEAGFPRGRPFHFLTGKFLFVVRLQIAMKFLCFYS